MITVFDAAGEGSTKTSWVLIRRARADSPESDKFEPASSHRKALAAATDCALPTRKTGQVLVRTSGRGSPTDSGPEIGYLEKPDRYWSAPQVAESPVISVPEIRYVRRSELNTDAPKYSCLPNNDEIS